MKIKLAYGQKGLLVNLPAGRSASQAPHVRNRARHEGSLNRCGPSAGRRCWDCAYQRFRHRPIAHRQSKPKAAPAVSSRTSQTLAWREGTKA